VATTTDSAMRTYKIDKSHSEVIFQVRHLVTKVRGRFDEFEGSVQIHEGQPDLSSVQFTIQATSIDTNEPQRDTHLRSADFFEVDKYPTITFKSKTVRRKSSESYEVVGDLSIHGVTKEIVLPVTHLGKAKDPWGKRARGFRGRDHPQPQGLRPRVERAARGRRLPRRRRSQGKPFRPGRRAVAPPPPRAAVENLANSGRAR
jgi:polyisoprenoid-binding protein YceI